MVFGVLFGLRCRHFTIFAYRGLNPFDIKRFSSVHHDILELIEVFWLVQIVKILVFVFQFASGFLEFILLYVNFFSKLLEEAIDQLFVFLNKREKIRVFEGVESRVI